MQGDGRSTGSGSRAYPVAPCSGDEYRLEYLVGLFQEGLNDVQDGELEQE